MRLIEIEKLEKIERVKIEKEKKKGENINAVIINGKNKMIKKNNKSNSKKQFTKKIIK